VCICVLYSRSCELSFQISRHKKLSLNQNGSVRDCVLIIVTTGVRATEIFHLYISLNAILSINVDTLVGLGPHGSVDG
jgi:hypothetical protein